MLIEMATDLQRLNKDKLPAIPRPRKMLMVDPRFFDVEYAINVHMLDEKGELNKVNKDKARQQWEQLKNAFESLGFPVDVVPGVQGLPDMVFSANQSLPLPNGKTVILSKMASSQRAREVDYFKKWYREKGQQVETLQLPEGSSFEAMGDAIWDHGKELLFGGFGYRTDREAYRQISERFHVPVVLLELVSKKYYHLDTCFSILDDKTVAIVPSAFAPESLELIHSLFTNVLAIDEGEGERFFAGNCYCPDDKHVLLHPGAKKFEQDLKALGFIPIPIDTSEFLKSGGSVFCMKLPLF